MNPRNLAVYRFSRPAVSTTHTPLQLHRCRVAGAGICSYYIKLPIRRASTTLLFLLKIDPPRLRPRQIRHVRPRWPKSGAHLRCDRPVSHFAARGAFYLLYYYTRARVNLTPLQAAYYQNGLTTKTASQTRELRDTQPYGGDSRVLASWQPYRAYLKKDFVR